MVKKVEKETLPDWLPKGWTIRIRPRRKSECNIKCNGGVEKYPGGTYACYIAPITNFKFYSKPEVLHYLHSGNKSTRSSTKSANGNTNKSTSKPAEREAQIVNAKGVNSRGTKEFGVWKESCNSRTDKFPEMDGSQKVLQCQVYEKRAKDSDLKFRTGSEVDKVPDCKAKIKYTKGTIKRTGMLIEENRLNKRIQEGNFNENGSVFSSAEKEFPDAVNGSSMIDVRNNGLKQPTELQVDQLMEKKMSNAVHEGAVHEGAVNKLRDRNVANSESLKGMNCSEVHIREERTRNVLKQLQGQILLPAGYIPQSPGTLRSISNGENVAELLESPFHYFMTDPCIVFTRSTPADTISTQRDKAENSVSNS